MELQSQEKKTGTTKSSNINSLVTIPHDCEVANAGRWSYNPISGETFWSKEMYPIFGYNPKETSPGYVKFLNSVYYDDRKIVKTFLDNAIKSCDQTKAFTITHRIVKENGEVRIVREQVEAAFNDNGKAILLSGTTLDITCCIEAKENLSKISKREKEASRIQEKLTGLVYNDIKMPLMSMLAQLGEVTFENQSEEDWSRIENVLKDGSNIIDKIDSALNRTGTHIGKVTPRFFDARMIALKVIGNFTYIAESKNITIVNEIPRETRLYANFTLLYTVLQNLFSNAISACRNGATITTFTPNGQSSTIGVKDTGCGIEQAKLPDLFKKKSEHPHGLAYCMDIMKAHNGSLSVKSTGKKGTTFHVSLPHKRPTVLIVDDEPTELILLSTYLEEIDVNILEANNGKQALEILDHEKPNLIVTDINMPVIDGLTLLERVKNNPETASIPIIVMTSDHLVQTKDKVFQLGADDFIHKLIITEDFIPRIRKFIV